MRRNWISVLLCVLALTLSAAAPDVLHALRGQSGEGAICLLVAADGGAPAVPSGSHRDGLCALCQLGASGIAPPPAPVAPIVLLRPVILTAFAAPAEPARSSPRRAAHGPRAPPRLA